MEIYGGTKGWNWKEQHPNELNVSFDGLDLNDVSTVLKIAHLLVVICQGWAVTDTLGKVQPSPTLWSFEN